MMGAESLQVQRPKSHSGSLKGIFMIIITACKLAETYQIHAAAQAVPFHYPDASQMSTLCHRYQHIFPV